MDVNAAFYAQKIAQMDKEANRAEWLAGELATGKLTSIGQNKYRINGGWDNGEVITVNLTTGTVQNDHGLDIKANGDVALYLKDTPAWHALGTVVPGGLTDTSEILAIAGLDFTVRKMVGRVALTEAEEDLGINNVRTKIVPRQYFNVRTDSMDVLGPVGEVYHPFQNREAFGFLQGVFGNQEMLCETAGSTRGGSSVFISAKLPEPVILDPSGVADEITQYVLIKNSHDGKTNLTAVVTPWRPVCKNTLRFSVRDAVTSFNIRHTQNGLSAANVRRAQETLLKNTTSYYKAWEKDAVAMLGTPMTFDQVDTLITEIWGEVGPQPSKRAVSSDRVRRAEIHEIWGIEKGRLGANAWAAYQAVTGWTDHKQTRRINGRGNQAMTPLEALGRAIVEEAVSLDKPKNSAHKLLMNRVRG